MSKHDAGDPAFRFLTLDEFDALSHEAKMTYLRDAVGFLSRITAMNVWKVPRKPRSQRRAMAPAAGRGR